MPPRTPPTRRPGHADVFPGRPKIAVTTPLGDDALLLEVLTGTESVSELFRFKLDLLAPPETTVTFDGLLGQSVTARFHLPDGTYRPVNGIVNKLSHLDDIPLPAADRDNL